MINPVMDINTECLHVRGFPYPALLEQSVLGVSPEIRTDQANGLKCPSWTTQLHCEQSGLQSSARMLSEKEIVDHYDSPDKLQTEISTTSTEMTGGSPPADIYICEGPDRLQTKISVTFHVNNDMNTDLQENLAPMLRSPTIFKWLCVVLSALPTLNQRIVNPTDVTMDMDTDPPESSAPMITSDLMVVDWEDIICGRPRYGGQDGHDMIDTDSSDPNVRKRMDTADLGYMCRTVVQDQRWSDTDDNSDADSVAELEYKTWEDACAWRYWSALVHIPPGLIQNPPTDKIRNYKTNDMSDTDSIAELNYSVWNDACAGDYQNMLGNIQNPPTCKIWNDDTDHSSDTDSVGELEYKTWEDACAWRCRSALVNIPPGLVQNPATGHIRHYETDDNSDADSVTECNNGEVNVPPGLFQNSHIGITRAYEMDGDSDADWPHTTLRYGAPFDMEHHYFVL